MILHVSLSAAVSSIPTRVFVAGGRTCFPARVRQIGRRVYLGSGPFFLISELLPRGIEGGKKKKRVLQKERGLNKQREAGSVTIDKIVLGCSLTLRPATACICFPRLCFAYTNTGHAYTCTPLLQPLIHTRHASLSTRGTCAALMHGIKCFLRAEQQCRKRLYFTNATTSHMILYGLILYIHDCSKSAAQIVLALF